MFGDVVEMESYRMNALQVTDPLAQLYMLEREMEAAEHRPRSMIDELARRIDVLEERVTEIGDNVEDANRKLELEIVALSDRIFALEKNAA